MRIVLQGQLKRLAVTGHPTMESLPLMQLPDTDIELELELEHSDRKVAVSVADGRPSMILTVGAEVIAQVTLGLEVDGIDLRANARFIAMSRRLVAETYTAYVGKSVGMRSFTHREIRVQFETEGLSWSLLVRAAKDGFAFRYVIDGEAVALGVEHSLVRNTAATRAWVLDYQTWYETPRFGSDLSSLVAGDYGLPVLVGSSSENYFLITESGIDGRSSGAHLQYDGAGFRFYAADESLTIAEGHATPWRVLIAGSLAEIVSSTLVDELAPAAEPGSVSVIPRPGRAAWSWWSSQYSGAYLDVQKRFCDFAADQGWEHVLVDCGWDGAWVPELVSYASERSIQVHLWSSWSDLDGPANLEKLALWRAWGVAGVKVDFMESESQERYRWYDAIIREAARVGLMLNFHGSVIPRGWARTHPHVISYEAIRGAEWYVFYNEALTASHNVMQPFTRNVIGSMDYTPVTFSAPGRETSDAHELALSVVFESGITHFADDPDQYRSRPLAEKFLAEVPSVWDESILLEGHPDSHVVMARRRGDRWFVGGISARAEPMTVHIDTLRFFSSPADVWMVADHNAELTESRADAKSSRLEVDMEPRGGFVAIVSGSGTPCLQAEPRLRLQLPYVGSRVENLQDGEAFLATDADLVRCAPGWTAEKAASGRWRVWPTSLPEPGDLAVFTCEGESRDGVPAVAHVRVLTPLTGPAISLSKLAFVSARNAIGPVERCRANGGGDPQDGGPLTVRGQVHEDGLGVSQSSEVTFAIAGDRRILTGSVAVDDETPHGEAIAEVIVDDVVVFRASIRGSESSHDFSIAVDGAKRLTLRTEAAEGDLETHVDWLDLQLVT